ncbi:MAG: prepilin-type N-terminal cleavage/methylation domain-containing protein [Candidatus Omnitrophota bacterium]
MKTKGFTLIEMMMVVVIVGILASMALARYIRVVEKGRSSEARHILGLIRDSELAYYVEWDGYTNNFATLGLALPGGSCNGSYHFRYAITGAPASFTATATRCTSGGKSPNAQTSFVLNITPAGVLNGTGGFV